MILVKSGRVINPKTGLDEILDIKIENGVIAGIGKYKRSEDYDEIIDAKGKIVAPGLIDVHVHFREPGFTYKEDINSGVDAAVAGGYTTVVCMANTKPIIDDENSLKMAIEKEEKAAINVLQVAAISKGFGGKELTDFEGLLNLGAIGFSDDGIPIKDGKFMREAMLKAKEMNVVLSLHEEDPDFIIGSGVNQGLVSSEIGYGGASSLSEYIMVARDCMLALETKARVNLQHLSSKESIKLVELTKSMGADVWAEATPQHFSATEELVIKKGCLARVNPPLRTDADRYGIIEGLKNNTIDIIATDHAPHAPEEKAKTIEEAPSGMIGLETALALGITNLVRTGHLTMSHLLEKMTMNPASLYSLDKGSIEIGKAADIVIFDEYESWEVKGSKSKAKQSPFDGEKVYGRVKYTIYEGNVVYRDEN